MPTQDATEGERRRRTAKERAGAVSLEREKGGKHGVVGDREDIMGRRERSEARCART